MLLISPEIEIKSWVVAFVARIRAYNSESAHESGRFSGSVQSKRRKYNAVAATPALH